jgi:hypothetical protein
MRKKVIYSIGILVLGFFVYSIIQASLSFRDQKSSLQLIAESKLKGTIARGFYVIDVQTKLPVASSSVTIVLDEDDDFNADKRIIVATKLTDVNGWVMFDGLKPNTSIVQATEKNKSNHYTISAETPFSCPRRLGSITMLLSEQGLYDSENIEVSAIDKNASCGKVTFIYPTYGFEFDYPLDWQLRSGFVQSTQSKTLTLSPRGIDAQVITIGGWMSCSDGHVRDQLCFDISNSIKDAPIIFTYSKNKSDVDVFRSIVTSIRKIK